MNLLHCDKDEYDKLLRDNTYLFSFITKISNLYNIECEEIDTPSPFILRYAFINGHCGLAKFDYDNKYHVGVGTYCGKPNADGYGDEYIVTLQNGQTKRGKIGDDIVVLKWDNIGMTQLPKATWLSNMLSETDTSIKCATIYSRALPIPIVEDDNETKSLMSVIDDLFKGKLSTFKRAQKKDYYGNRNPQAQNTFDITNPQNSVYIQNLSRLHQELLERACIEYGIHITTRDKGAQLTERELNAFEDYCAIGSDDTFCQLLEFADNCKNVFGLTVKVTPKNYTHTEEDIIDESLEVEELADDNKEVLENETDRTVQEIENEQ